MFIQYLNIKSNVYVYMVRVEVSNVVLNNSRKKSYIVIRSRIFEEMDLDQVNFLIYRMGFQVRRENICKVDRTKVSVESILPPLRRKGEYGA